jgi:Sulfotransferase family
MRAPGPRPRASRWASLRSRVLASLRSLPPPDDENENGVGEPRPAGGVNVPPAPPQCPSGWRTGAPDYVGVGFQRCSTTRWYDLITSHPEVATPATIKELHFFDRFHSGGATEQELAAYHEYFPRPEGQQVGEWTPLYASGPWIPPLLAASAPQARLLVIVRDPVERLISGLALDAAVAARQGLPLSRYAPLEAFMRGLYHAQISLLLRHFDRSRLLVLQYERCVVQPAAELRRTFAFLGVREDYPVARLDAHPRRRDEKPDFDRRTRQAYIEAYSEDVARLGATFNEVDLGLWPNFGHLAG